MKKAFTFDLSVLADPVAKLMCLCMILFIGDEIPKEDTAKLLDELADKEDEDGFIPYVPFIDRLCGKA